MGAWTTGLTTTALILVAISERIPVFKPINAVSHIIFGDSVLSHTVFDPKFSLTGLALNTGALIGWSAVAELGYTAFQIPRGSVLLSSLIALILTTTAFITDFYIVPKRFTPGFEKVISQPGLFFVYVCLAIGFAFGGIFRVS